MAIYVDPILDHGWRHGPSCHLFTDEVNLDNLHALAARIGLRQAWFQLAVRAPHYDLTLDLRRAAIEAGAIALNRREAVGVWKARRLALAEP